MANSDSHHSPVYTPRMTPLLRTFLQQRASDADNLDLGIHPNDEMLHYLIELYDGDWNRASVAYIESGFRVFQMTNRILVWRFGGSSQVKLLDFASGYGRTTRHLLQSMNPDCLVVSDVMREAVTFQNQHFGVEGIVSTTDPGDFLCDRTFSYVQVISLFSHLPEKMFRQWLARLWRLVNPGGILMFSVHDRSLCGAGHDRGDFIFAQESENQLLDPTNYGTTWVTEDYVAGALRQEIDGYSYRRFPRGLANYQDVYVVTREEGSDFSGLDCSSGLDGHIDYADFQSPGMLRCFGWAVHQLPERTVEGIRFSLNGELLATTTEFHPREDVMEHFDDEVFLLSGWNLEIRLPDGISFSDDAVIITVVGSHGDDQILHMGCVHSLVAETARKNLADVRAKLESMK